MNADESRRSEYVSAVGILHDGQNLSARNLHEAALKRFKKARTSFQVLGVAVEVARCDLEIANSYYGVGDLARAKASYKRANNGYVDKKMNFEAAQCEAALGKVAIDIGNFNESLGHYKTSTELFLLSGKKVSAAKSQMNRGDAHYNLKEYDSAESHYLAARKVFEEDLKLRLAAKCTLGLAKVALARRQYNEAERLVRSAWLYFLLDGGDADKAACDQHLGLIYLELREFAKARIYISSARRTFIECGAKYGVAECELDLAYIDDGQQNWESARSRYFSALEQFRNLRNRAKVVECCSGIGRVLFMLGEWKAAVQWEREGVKFHQDAGNIRLALRHKYNVAMILYESRQFEDARRALVALLGEAKRAGDEYWPAYCQLLLGSALIELGSSVSARKHIIEAQHTFVDQGVRLGAADCSRALGFLSFDLGQYGLAVRNFEDARRIYLDEGDHLRAASCDVNIARSAGHGWSLGGAQPSVLMCRKELRGVIGNLIGAIRYLSSLRFQFPTSHERLQWVDRISSGLSIAYWWAQYVDDEKLISELIEFQINSGVHGVGRLADSELLPRFGRMALGEMQGPSSGSGGEVGAVSESLKMSGEDGLLSVRSQLIPGAILPMLPPPELKFPDGHLAFEDWLSQVESRICSVIDRMHAVSIE